MSENNNVSQKQTNEKTENINLENIKVEDVNLDEKIENITPKKQETKTLTKEEIKKKKEDEKREILEKKAIKKKKKEDEKKLKNKNKKPFKDTPFGYFIVTYWFMIGFLFVSSIFLGGTIFIESKYKNINSEFEELGFEYENQISTAVSFLEEWERQMSYISDEDTINNKIDKKNDIRLIVDKYTKSYILSDDERGNFTLRVRKNDIIDSQINRLLLELKKNKNKFSIKGLSKNSIEIVLSFKV